MTKPLDMTDKEILDWIEKHPIGVALDGNLQIHTGGSIFKADNWLVSEWSNLRQAVCQAAAILKEKK